MIAASKTETFDGAGTPTCWLLAGFAALLFSTLQVQASDHRDSGECPGPVLIRGHNPQMEDLICEAVEQARELLEPCGLTQTRPIDVQIVNEMDDAHGACVAYFDCETDSLTILAPAAISSSGDVMSSFSQVLEDEYFQSVIVHEMTHAFAHQSYPQSFSRIAHEYLAYAMQIASLSVESRTSALKTLQTPGKATFKGIDEIGLLFGPSQFALRSYEHFWRPENRCAIIDRIVSSDPRLPEAFQIKASN